MIALDRTWQPVASCSGSHSHLFFPPSVTERKEERERRETEGEVDLQDLPGRRRVP